MLNEYCLSVSIGQPDRISNIILVGWLVQANDMNIDSVYSLVRQTGYPNFYRWSGRIRRMLNRYSLSVSIGQPDRISNIIWVVWLDQANVMNIDSVYPLVSRTGYPILYGWSSRIRRMPNRY